MRVAFECILWNNDGTSDKLWGITHYNDHTVSFWGRRGRELQFKLISESDARNGYVAKLRKKGYRETTMTNIENITPGFAENFRHMLVLCIMGDNFHRMNA